MKTFLYFLCFMYPTWWRRLWNTADQLSFLEFEKKDYRTRVISGNRLSDWERYKSEHGFDKSLGKRLAELDKEIDREIYNEEAARYHIESSESGNHRSEHV